LTIVVKQSAFNTRIFIRRTGLNKKVGLLCTQSSLTKDIAMDMGLSGRLALVTGSTQGLGKAIAIALAQEGAEVIVNGRHKESILKTMGEISDRYRVQTWACPIDVSDNEAIKTFFKLGPIAARGSLDILVNNVGNIEKFASFTELTDEDWMRCYELTFMSVVRFTREALPFLIASNNGRVVNISSIISQQPGSFPQYSASKAAVENLTKYLANIYGSKNVRVNGVRASALKSGAWELIVKDRAEKRNITVQEAEKTMENDESKKAPLGRMAGLQDVADMVMHLVSNKASFITGEIINVDGGITRGL